MVRYIRNIFKYGFHFKAEFEHPDVRVVVIHRLGYKPQIQVHKSRKLNGASPELEIKQ